jgi:hypothetical protein
MTDDVAAFLEVEDLCGSVRRNGAGCLGTNGLRPDLQLNGCSKIGGTVTLEMFNGQPNGLAVLFFGTGPFEEQIGQSDCYLNVSGLFPPSVPLPLDAAGNISVPEEIPHLPSAPIHFHMQAFASNPGSALGYATSNALNVTINP